MCLVQGLHKDRSNQVSQEDLQKGPALRADRQVIKGLMGYAKGEGR